MYDRQERMHPELLLILYLFVVVVSLFCYFYPIPFHQWGAEYIVAAIILLFTFLVYRKNFTLFVSILFFVLLYLSHPLIRVQETLIPLHFPGVLFAIPVIAYIVILHLSRKCRGEISWRAAGSVDRCSLLLMLAVIVISAFALIGWTLILEPDLKPILSWIPRVHIGLLILGGFGFALSNALVEELIYRGILWDGLKSTVRSTAAVIIIQAGLFGLWHWRGFPGGVVGVLLVFVWGILLGIIRRRTGGMLAPILTHIGADLTIFGILLLIVQK